MAQPEQAYTSRRTDLKRACYQAVKTFSMRITRAWWCERVGQYWKRMSSHTRSPTAYQYNANHSDGLVRIQLVGPCVTSVPVSEYHIHRLTHTSRYTWHSAKAASYLVTLESLKVLDRKVNLDVGLVAPYATSVTVTA
eukprot:3941930-Rhodomonas_salina.19